MKNFSKTLTVISIISIISIILLASCVRERGTEYTKASDGLRIATICIDGVEYLYFKLNTVVGRGGSAFLSPHFKQDGSLYLCDMEERGPDD
jgi:hypothetical protein